MRGARTEAGGGEAGSCSVIVVVGERISLERETREIAYYFGGGRFGTFRIFAESVPIYTCV